MPKRPEEVWPVADEYEELYATVTAEGRAAAAAGDAVIVGIARNALPYLPNTLGLVSEAQAGFRSCRSYIYENDSTDGTAACLDVFAASHRWLTVEHDTLGGIDSRGFEPERTIRLAHCRNKCQEWVRQNAADATWTIVLDLDPHGGFSPDGIFNSIGWLLRKQAEPAPLKPAGMASFSLWAEHTEEGQPPRIAQYDSWAARPNWWRDRREEVGFGWFSMLLFPVGSPPMQMNSAFGGLAVYDTRAFLAPRVAYAGGDCEHVPLHKSMHEAGYQLWLNPGARYIAYWQ